MRVLPFEEVNGLRRDGPEARLLVAGANNKLVRVEQPLISLWCIGPLPAVGVPLQLVDRILHWRGEVRAFTLYDDQGDAVHEEDDIRDDKPLRLTTRLVNAELAHGPERVVPGILPVDEVDGPVPAAVPAGDSVYRRALDEKLCAGLVRLDEVPRAVPLEGRDGLAHPAVVKPPLSLVVSVGP